MEQFDLHNWLGSADYIHTIVEAMKLAYADRDAYYSARLREGAVEGFSRSLREGARRADRSDVRQGIRGRRSLRFDSQ